ncbi:rRNA pseudouridine synthase [Actinomyces viscosus]|uniref:Pseudouridine synthase n=1 Tax=Actinomyces viscosus TaxID=1656 RepID=A0A448PJ82_ACTVI|nr:pseudouridine synthase [Actinomyces viscosus]TFH53903.1 rRNA pseudouridine synthase [Actinomyces viscosus]VEI14960.1 Ribosomal large subunit pseudouridine synthase B [Actinomyces viscosus]
MTPRNRHSRNDSVLHGDFGGQEFYDDDDLEELDEETDAADLAAFDAEAIDEDEESRLLAMRERASKGGEDDPHVASGQRLQKVLAHAGLASRRACEQLIADGRVSVDGVTVTEPGVRVDPLTQEVRVDGSRILTNPELITLMLHKPAGVVTTMEDSDGRPTVAQYGRDYLAQHPELPDSLRLVHVGRLDTETEGLLLLSNDGELAHRLMHPSFEIAKTYVAIVEGQVEPWVPRKLRRGIELEDGEARADRATVKDSGPRGSIVEITLHSGKNRIVRRMLDAVGHPVTRLARTRLGPLRLGNLRPGETRALTSEEIAALQQEVGL